MARITSLGRRAARIVSLRRSAAKAPGRTGPLGVRTLGSSAPRRGVGAALDRARVDRAHPGAPPPECRFADRTVGSRRRPHAPADAGGHRALRHDHTLTDRHLATRGIHATGLVPGARQRTDQGIGVRQCRGGELPAVLHAGRLGVAQHQQAALRPALGTSSEVSSGSPAPQGLNVRWNGRSSTSASGANR